MLQKIISRNIEVLSNDKMNSMISQNLERRKETDKERIY